MKGKGKSKKEGAESSFLDERSYRNPYLKVSGSKSHQVDLSSLAPTDYCQTVCIHFSVP